MVPYFMTVILSELCARKICSYPEQRGFEPLRWFKSKDVKNAYILHYLYYTVNVT